MNIHHPVSRQFIVCVTLFLLLSKAVFSAVTDTTALTPSPILTPVTNFNAKKALKQDFTYMGLGFIASGFIVKSRKEDFRSLRHYFQPTFKTTWDNYAKGGWANEDLTLQDKAQVRFLASIRVAMNPHYKYFRKILKENLGKDTDYTDKKYIEPLISDIKKDSSESEEML